ncbi:substrate-binding domain-containing protein, partial [Angustibacter aerolatus]
MRPPGRLRAALLLTAALGALAATTAAPAQAKVHAPVNGSGSSWSSNAVNQWIADVTPSGLKVTFTANGSATGRKNFAFKTTDFALSDIGFQGSDSVTGEADTSNGRAFAYLPIVAGGTSFPYQIRVGTKKVRDLRLSSSTLAKIFTNQITNWNDPAVTKDNNGRQLPSLPIIPVVHSEGSGSTAQFTRYLDTVEPGTWRPFLGRSGLTEYYPRKGQAVAQNGSDGVINYINSAAANGAIGFDEYSYALAKNMPVAKLRNAAGYFTLPTQYNVAVALTQAQINTDKSSPNYLLQNLDRVYTYRDVRTYALSSYSYMIIPTAANDQTMTTGKRQTLADYLKYSICEGQREMGPIGYSPLPINLVQASFDQTAKLKQADPDVDVASSTVSSCRNPTFVPGQPKRNYLAEIAPKPPACDEVGAGPCSGSTAVAIGNPVGGKAPTSGGSAPAAGGGTTGGAAGGGASSASGGSGGSGAGG